MNISDVSGSVTKLEKVKKLMELTGITATLKRDFNILRHPFGAMPIPIELVRIETEEEESFIDKFAEMYGNNWDEKELDEVISFLTDNPAGRKLVDPLFKEQAAAGCKVFIDRMIAKVEPGFRYVFPGNDVVQ